MVIQNHLLPNFLYLKLRNWAYKSNWKLNKYYSKPDTEKGVPEGIDRYGYFAWNQNANCKIKTFHLVLSVVLFSYLRKLGTVVCSLKVDDSEPSVSHLSCCQSRRAKLVRFSVSMVIY